MGPVAEPLEPPMAGQPGPAQLATVAPEVHGTVTVAVSGLEPAPQALQEVTVVVKPEGMADVFLAVQGQAS